MAKFKAPKKGPSRTFRFFWIIDLLVALVFLAFFFIGLADGSVSTDNLLLWVGILFGLAVVLFGSYGLSITGHNVLAMLVVLLVALPGLLYGLFLLLVLLSGESWN